MTTHLTAKSIEPFTKPALYEEVLVDPYELYQRFATSEHGNFQAKQPLRFAQNNAYSYGDRETFLKELGPDVHPVEHMLHTHDAITLPLIAEQRSSLSAFTPDEIVELRTAAMLHDVGECTHPSIAPIVGFEPAGDMKYGTFAPDHKAQEKIVRNHIFNLYYSDVPPRLLNRVDQIDLKEADDFAVQSFEVIERLGYYMTACRAADLVMEVDGQNVEDTQRLMQLGRLAVIVGHNHQSFLCSKASTYPFVERILDELASR